MQIINQNKSVVITVQQVEPLPGVRELKVCDI